MYNSLIIIMIIITIIILYIMLVMIIIIIIIMLIIIQIMINMIILKGAQLRKLDMYLVQKDETSRNRVIAPAFRSFEMVKKGGEGKRQKPALVCTYAEKVCMDAFWIHGLLEWAKVWFGLWCHSFGFQNLDIGQRQRGRGLYWFVGPPRQPLSGTIPSQSSQSPSFLTLVHSFETIDNETWKMPLSDTIPSQSLSFLTLFFSFETKKPRLFRPLISPIVN